MGLCIGRKAAKNRAQYPWDRLWPAFHICILEDRQPRYRQPVGDIVYPADLGRVRVSPRLLLAYRPSDSTDSGGHRILGRFTSPNRGIDLTGSAGSQL